MDDEQFDDDFVIASGSPDFRSELAAQLAELAPEIIADGKVDVAKLQELLGEDVADSAERFGLFWPGKKNALRVAQAPTTATLRPDIDNSKDWDTTQNVFIEGDNLEVLKILQKHYHNKIKMIYIDPPYNTGKDFVYPDNFKEGLDSYLEWTRQVNEEGKKLSSNLETEGSYHSNWLNMMYPRLKLARNLLTDDGFIFISISDVELGNLRSMMNIIFGEGNFVETFIWQSIFRPSNMSSKVRRNAEYILCYQRSNAARSVEFLERLEDPQGEASLTQNNNSVRQLEFPKGSIKIKIPSGVYPAGVYGDISLDTDLEVSDGTNVSNVKISGKFKWSQAYLNNEIEQGVHLAIKTMGFIPYYRKDYQQTALKPTKILPRDLVGDVLQANAVVEQLGLGSVFDYPKPPSLIKLLAKIVRTKSQDVILDFFAGSSSTAHGIMELNLEDGGSRKFVMVQLPEPTPEGSEARKAGYETIADISRERIRRAGDAIVAERDGQLNTGEQPLDVGFRFYKLSASNFVKWQVTSDVEAGKLGEHLLSLRGSADDDATPDDLLSEVLLKQGYSLTEQISKVDISGLELHSVGDGLVLAYLNEHVKPTLDQFRAFVDAGPSRLIVLEDAYQGDDQLKTNVEQLCKSKSVELWRA